MNSALLPGSDYDHDLIDSGLGDTPTPTFQDEIFPDRNAKSAFFHDGEVKYMPEGFQQDAQGRMIPTSSTQHSGEGAHEGEESDNGNAEDGSPSDDWRNLVNFHIPDHTQCDFHSLPRLSALYDAYTSMYTPSSSPTNTKRMLYAKALAFALLTHYHPTSHGYTVTPSPLPPIAKPGLNFILAAADESDIWHDLLAKTGITPSNCKKMKKRAPTLAQQHKAQKARKTREYNHGMAWTMGLSWLRIPPEDIALFVVQRKRHVLDEETGASVEKWWPYTYLAIIIHSDDEPPRLSSGNVVHPYDVLTAALCGAGTVQQGHGILLHGTKLGFYGFDAGPAFEPLETDSESEEIAGFEPRVWLLEEAMEMCLRDARWESVDAAFKKTVVEMGGFV